jgi:hypothetical protein
MTKDSGHGEYNEKCRIKEGKGNVFAPGSRGNSILTKYCGKKVNKFVKCRVIGEMESEEFVALVTTVKMGSSIEVETCVKPTVGYERMNHYADDRKNRITVQK